jgi:hypothetical protein
MDTNSRTKLYRQLFPAAEEKTSTLLDFLEPDLESARYKLGTGIADRVLPYVIDDSVTRIFRAALTELVYLYISRNRRFVGEEVFDTMLLKSDHSIASLRPVAYQAPEHLKNQTMRMAMHRAPRIFIGLDSGILTSWWGNDGRGRELLVVWTELMSQAFEEMHSTEGENTPYLLQWIMLDAYNEANNAVDSLSMSGPTRQEILAVVLLGLHLCHHVVMSQTITKEKQSGNVDMRLRLRWGAVLNLRIAVGSIVDKIAGFRAYPVAAKSLGKNMPTLSGILNDQGYKKAEETVKQWLRKDKELYSIAIGQVLREWVREQVIELMSLGFTSNSETWLSFQSHLRGQGGFEAILREKKIRKNASRLFEEAAKQDRFGVPAKNLSEMLKHYNSKRPTEGIYPETEAKQRATNSILADLGDQIVAGIKTKIQNRFSRRTGQESDRDIVDEYEGGRLYRIGRGITPFIKGYKKAGNVGHYFIDVKDYTQRTALLKEEVMADFIRREFYEPILAIANEEYKGLPQLSDRGGVHLNNLLGDAVSYSGDIVAMVNISRKIREHLNSFSSRLSSRQDGSLVSKLLKSIDQEFFRAKQRLEKSGEMSEASLVEVQKQREEAISRITGQHLISGSFISFGSSAAVVTFRDPIWGEVAVSIAEKINESARGTSRAGSVMATMQALLNYRRQKTNNMNLQLPYLVYVGNTLDFSMSTEAELALRHAFSQGDAKRALDIYIYIAREHVKNTISGGRRTVQSFLTKGMTLYNAGDAISGEALTAYREALEGQVLFKERTIPVSALEQKILQHFAFFENEINLVVGFSRQGQIVEIFRYAGTIIFKGFEKDSPTEIWEMIELQSPIGRMFFESQSVIGSKLSSW